jgi:phosphonopyruvate decarboxylase
MIKADVFVEAAYGRGLGLWTGVPCSYLKPFINFTIDSRVVRYVGAANEGDAVAIASGSWLGGMGAVAMFQNSGLGNAVNPLTSLNLILKIPILLITTWRGEPGGEHDEPQHAVMGAITPRMLEVMGIPWELFPTTDDQIEAVLDRAFKHMQETRTPYALIMQKDSVAPHKLATAPRSRTSPAPTPSATWPAARPTRKDVLETVRACTGPEDILIATTGYTGRELYALGDQANQLYMVGSMGCASSFGLGLALARPDRRILVLDGDGAMLMRLGALSTIGAEAPANLLHLLLDNEVHESTGAQATTSTTTDLAAVAAACGYPAVVRAGSTPEIEAAVQGARSLTFVHCRVQPGVPDELPRPAVTPDAVVTRLRQYLTR